MILKTQKLEIEKLKLELEMKTHEETLKQKQKQHEETLASKKETEKKKLMQSLLTKMQPLKDNERVELNLEQFERWANTQSIVLYFSVFLGCVISVCLM